MQILKMALKKLPFMSILLDAPYTQLVHYPVEYGLVSWEKAKTSNIKHLR